MADEVLLELIEELERKLVLAAQRLLTDDSLHSRRVASNGVLSVQLIRHVAMILHRRISITRLRGYDAVRTLRVSFSPMALFINRESEGRTLMGG